MNVDDLKIANSTYAEAPESPQSSISVDNVGSSSNRSNETTAEVKNNDVPSHGFGVFLVVFSLIVAIAFLCTYWI